MGLQQLQEGIQIADADLTEVHRVRGNPGEPELDRQDNARQANAAQRRGEEVALGFRCDPPRRPIRHEQVDPIDMIAEVARAVLVLAVDVVGDRAPHA